MTYRTRIVRIAAALVCICGLTLGAVPALEAQDAPPEAAKRLIVKVSGKLDGAGIIFDVRGGYLFIITAYHVVKGSGPAGVTVEFEFLRGVPVAADLRNTNAKQDLAVLRIDLDNRRLRGLALEQIPFDLLNASGVVEERAAVFPIGHPGGDEWFTPLTPARVLEVIFGAEIRIEFACTPGYSGGGLFAADGALAGMILCEHARYCEAISWPRICATLEDDWHLAVTRDRLPPAPTPTPSVEQRTQQQIAELLQTADAYFAKKWYTTPAETSALPLYRKVLTVDPLNAHALEKIDRIAQFYKSRAEHEEKRGRTEQAVQYYQKYLTVAPEDAEVLDRISALTAPPTPRPTMPPTPRPTMAPTARPTTAPLPVPTATPTKEAPLTETPLEVTLTLEPDVRTITLDRPTEIFIIATPTKQYKIQFQWRLDGPGQICGDTTAPGIIYVPPGTIAESSTEVTVMVTVTDKAGERRTTASVALTLLKQSTARPTAAPTPQPTPTAGQTRRDPVSGMDFVWIPAGCFQMGCDSGINCSGNEKPVHRVCLDGFWMGKTEVTQAQWQQVMRENPASFDKDEVGQDTSQHPVDNVSWNAVQEFLQNLNEQAGKEVYRLPTEAEWEYAARAGTATMFYFGDDPDTLGEYAWYGSKSDGETHPAGQLEPNAWGLYDMHGNVWEWCQDWYDSDYYSQSPQDNPQGPSSGKYRVIRGGDFGTPIYDLRSANRNRYYPAHGSFGIGFRVVIGALARPLR